jgi:hypothetical protein
MARATSRVSKCFNAKTVGAMVESVADAARLALLDGAESPCMAKIAIHHARLETH